MVDSGAEVPSHPDGVVLSPSFVGRNRPEVSMWVTWRADGTCDYAFSGIRPDDTSLSSGDLVGIQFVNRSSEGAAIAFSSNNTIPTLHALAKPTSDTQLWVVLRPGQYTITCDVGDADPEGQVHARSFVVPDPSACPPGPGVANTGLSTPVERFYDAVKARDANAALAAFSADAVVGSLHSGIDFVTFVLADPPEAVSISNIVVDGDLITWDEEWSDDGFLERSCGMQATIVQDRIKRWVFGDSPGQ